MMAKRTSRAFRPCSPTSLEGRVTPGGGFLGNLGDTFSSLGRHIAEPYVRLGNRIIGEDMTPPRHPTYSAFQIRRWTVIARVVSGELAAPRLPMNPLLAPPAMMPDAP
jgi:hypothetical protein